MRWFKDADGKWYYGDRPYPTHAKAPPVPRSEGLAEPTGDVIVTAKGGAATEGGSSAPSSSSPFAAAAQQSVARRVLLQQGRVARPPRAMAAMPPKARGAVPPQQKGALLLQGPPMRVTVNAGRRVVGGRVVEEGEPTTFLVYPDGTRIQVNPPPDPPGTRVVRQPNGTYVKILPSGRRILLGEHPYPTPTMMHQDTLQQYWDSLSDEEYIKEYGHPKSWAQQSDETIEEWSKRYDRLYAIYKARVAAGWRDPFKGIR